MSSSPTQTSPPTSSTNQEPPAFAAFLDEQYYKPGQLDEHREKHSCLPCAERGERTADSKYIPAKPTKLKKDLEGELNNRDLVSTDSLPQQQQPPADDCFCVAYQNSLCPLNRRELGRASWAHIHTVASNYPESPTTEQQQEMKSFIKTWAKLYPCGYCADMTSNEMIRRPPKVSNRNEFQLYMCGIHNEVNWRIGKPVFDCTKYDERWRRGLADGSCGVQHL